MQDFTRKKTLVKYIGVFLILLNLYSCIKIVQGKPNLIWSKKIDSEKKIISNFDFDFKPIHNNSYIALGSIDTKQVIDKTDILLIKISSTGDIIWSRTYGGNDNQIGRGIIETHDNGLAICGSDKDQLLLLKTDSDGNQLWNNTFGKTEKTEIGYSIIETKDRGFIILGGVFEDSNIQDSSVYIVKTSWNGSKEWTKTFGRIKNGYNLIEAEKDGYLFVSGNSSIKFSYNGSKLWEKEYKVFEFFKKPNLNLNSISLTKNGYFIFGRAEHHGLYTSDEGDYGAYILIKTDFNGDKIWQKLYDYPNVLGNYSIESKTTIDGGLIYSDHNNILTKTYPNGTIEWYQHLDDLNHTIVQQATDGGYIIAGLDWVRNGYWIYLYYYEPDYFRLNIESEYGETKGTGVFKKDNETWFSVSPERIYLSETQRVTFNEWKSESINGYNGEKNPVLIIITNSIRETATWETEYFINISSSNGGSFNTTSGWYTLGSKINIEAVSKSGYHFIGWKDLKTSKFINKNPYLTIYANKSMHLQGVFVETFYKLNIQSKFGQISGEGIYREKEVARFQVEPTKIEEGLVTRHIFTGWTCNTTSDCKYDNNIASVSMNRNLLMTAIWKTQYYLEATVDNGGKLNIDNGWHDEGSLIQVNVNIEPEFNFVGLYDSFNEELLTADPYMSIIIDKPMKIHAQLEQKKKPIPSFPLISFILAIILSYKVLQKKKTEKTMNVFKYLMKVYLFDGESYATHILSL
jgi:hypothetical protein